MENKEAENRYITMAYKLYTIDEEGRDFTEEAPAAHPFMFISGLGMTLDDFEKNVVALEKGAKFDFTLTAEQAYGDYDDENVIDLPKQVFLIDGKFDEKRFAPGVVVPLMTAEGQHINGSVVEVKEDVVVMDMNHPLASCALNFVGEIIENRPATPAEISDVLRSMSGGCGGHCGGCGGDCGSGCNCGGDCCD